MQKEYIAIEQHVNDGKILKFHTLAKEKNGEELNAESKMYFEMLEKMLMHEVAAFNDGKTGHDRLYGTLEAIDSVMVSTEDDLALSMLQDLYDRALKMAGLE